MGYKWCVVSQCTNTSISSPNKLFVSVPRTLKRRKIWLKLAGRDPKSFVTNSRIFMCEDHFDMENDMKNYMKYKMGFSKQILMADDAVPTKFHCQEERRRRLRMSDGVFTRAAFLKRQRIGLVVECLQSQSAIGTNAGSLHKNVNTQLVFEPEVLKMGKTNAEICKDYRRRKKAAKEAEKQQSSYIIKIPIKKTGAERNRAYKLRKKMLALANQSSATEISHQPVPSSSNSRKITSEESLTKSLKKSETVKTDASLNLPDVAMYGCDVAKRECNDISTLTHTNRDCIIVQAHVPMKNSMPYNHYTSDNTLLVETEQNRLLRHVPIRQLPDATPPNTTLKGLHNQLKIVSVTSKLSHWDLRRRYGEQHNYSQEYPELKTDMEEYTKEDDHFQEYSKEYKDFQEYTKTKMLEYAEDVNAKLDATHENIEVKKEIVKELDSSDNFVKDEESDSSDSFVKDEPASDLDIDDSETAITNVEHNMTKPGHFNIRIKEELEKSEPEQNFGENDEYIMRKEKIGSAVNHFEKVNKVLKHFEKMNEMPQSDYEVDDEFSVLKCTLCYKAFLGDDAYNEHMKKHITAPPAAADEVSVDAATGGIVVKVGDPLSTRSTTVRVKKVRLKRLAKNKGNEENITINTITIRSKTKINNCDSSQNNSDSSENKVDSDSDIVDKGNKDNKTKLNTITTRSKGLKNIHDCISAEINNCDSALNYSDSSENIVDSDTVQNYSDTVYNNVKTIVHNVTNNAKVEDDTVKVEDDNDRSDTVKVDNDSSNAIDIENKDLLVEIPGKTKIMKLKKKTRKNKKHITVVYRRCDENCTNDKHCTQSKECRRRQRIKRNANASYVCTLCDCKCKNKSILDAHMLTHNRVKSFHCHLCDYKCVQKCQLDQHTRTHYGTKPYSCNRCGYECVQKSQLDQHTRTHTRVRPFSCNFCQYTCTQRCHLDQHMRRHTGIKPYSCEYCEYTCVQWAHLNRHIMNVHRNVHVFRCQHCKYRCLQLKQLAKHMKAHCGEPA